jgi:ribonuclease HII
MGKTDVVGKQQWIGREHELSLQGSCEFVIGCDEAGRGPLAGPVTGAAVLVKPGVVLDGVVDSKTLTSREERERMYEMLTRHKDVVSMNQ